MLRDTPRNTDNEALDTQSSGSFPEHGVLNGLSCLLVPAQGVLRYRVLYATCSVLAIEVECRGFCGQLLSHRGAGIFVISRSSSIDNRS